MEALERQADKIRAAKAQSAVAAATSGAAEGNPEEIDLDMDMDEEVHYCYNRAIGCCVLFVFI